MPIANRYTQGNTLFSRASTECVIRHLNSAPKGDGGVDADTENVNGGICSGITSAWVASLLNANKVPEARDTAKFSSLFTNVLRFQGAYFKELHGTAEDHLQKVGERLITNGVKDSVLEVRNPAPGNLPKSGWWAAYVSMHGHAIGVGKYDGFYHIMEPNFGLFTYRNEGKFLTDLQNLINSYMGKKGYGAAKTAKFIFYKRSTGGRTA